MVLKSWIHFPSLPQEQGIASGYCLTDDGEVELDVLGGGVAVVNAATVYALVLWRETVFNLFKLGYDICVKTSACFSPGA